MKLTVLCAVAAVGCAAVPVASGSLLRAPEAFGDRAAKGSGRRGAAVGSGAAAAKKGKSSKSAKSAKSDKECRRECEADYCPDDGSCIDKCKECCTPEFTCDDSDFPNGGGDRDLRCSLGDDSCGSGDFCKVGDYACSEESSPPGRCRAVVGDSAPCPFVIAQVCGCDGNTYDNKCLAYAAGVNVAKNDACELPGNGGEKCYLDDDDVCTPGLFCRVGSYACGEEDNPRGRCASKPEACTYEIREVCGCDGKTYSNPCQAYAAGVNIERNEPCPKESSLGDECYFDDSNSCGDGLFCKIRDYYCKYEVNPEGKCRYEPRDTSCTYESEPVCGCDCKTYANKCAAHAAGMNVYANSKCPRKCEYPKELSPSVSDLARASA